MEVGDTCSPHAYGPLVSPLPQEQNKGKSWRLLEEVVYEQVRQKGYGVGVGNGQLMALREPCHCKVILVITFQLVRQVRNLSESPVEERTQRCQVEISYGPSLSCLSLSLGWIPPLPRESQECALLVPMDGSSRQKGGVLRSPAEKLIHTLTTGTPFSLSKLEQPRVSETSFNLS